MPAAFTQRRYELRATGMCLPANAPEWASDGYRIWSEADANTAATGDATAASAWHVVCQIPTTVSEDYWEWLLIGFIKCELSGKGAIVAWAMHSLQGDDGEWIVKPHFRLVVTRLRWRHRAADFGQPHPNWLSGRKAQARFQAAWFLRCGSARLGRRLNTGGVIPWMA